MYKIIYILIISIFIIFLFSNNIYAFSWDKIEQDVSSFTSQGDADQPISIDSMVNELLPIGQTLATIATMVLLAVAVIMGVKYMFANAEEQAKLKQQLIGLVVAAMIIFGAYNIWNLAYNTFSGIFKSNNSNMAIQNIPNNNGSGQNTFTNNSLAQNNLTNNSLTQNTTNNSSWQQNTTNNNSSGQNTSSSGNTSQEPRREVGVEVNGVKVTESVHSSDWKQRGLIVTNFSSSHDGIDINGVPTSPLISLTNGIVTKLTSKKDVYGNKRVNITVRNDDGTEQQYLHLEKANIKQGDRIKTGQQIAKSGYIPESIPACAKGTVVEVHENFGKVIVDCGNGLKIAYLHMSSISVKKGDAIDQGEEIGKMGDLISIYDPPSSHVHLHISFIMNGKYVNPRNYIYR